jgi:hypothetical protein
MTTTDAVRAAYEAAKGQWTACDWPTHYGCLGLDLEGVTCREARQVAAHWADVARGAGAYDNLTTEEESALVDMARHLRLRKAVVYLGEERGCHLEVRGLSARLFCAESLATEWEFAGLWLDAVESDAVWAEVEARQAVAAVARGDWAEALWRAETVGLIEAEYGGRRAWRHLRRVIQDAAAARVVGPAAAAGMAGRGGLGGGDRRTALGNR